MGVLRDGGTFQNIPDQDGWVFNGPIVVNMTLGDKDNGIPFQHTYEGSEVQVFSWHRELEPNDPMLIELVQQEPSTNIASSDRTSLSGITKWNRGVERCFSR